MILISQKHKSHKSYSIIHIKFTQSGTFKLLITNLVLTLHMHKYMHSIYLIKLICYINGIKMKHSVYKRYTKN